jgi:hypothetical protein
MAKMKWQLWRKPAWQYQISLAYRRRQLAKAAEAWQRNESENHLALAGESERHLTIMAAKAWQQSAA